MKVVFNHGNRVLLTAVMETVLGYNGNCNVVIETKLLPWKLCSVAIENSYFIFIKIFIYLYTAVIEDVYCVLLPWTMRTITMETVYCCHGNSVLLPWKMCTVAMEAV